MHHTVAPYTRLVFHFSDHCVVCTLALSFRTSVFDVKGKKLLSNRSDGPENKLASFKLHFLEKAQEQSN